MRQVRLLSDDVTGACDAGAAFLRAGDSVRVWFGYQTLFPVSETVQAMHTASRALPAAEAAEVVSRAAAGLIPDKDAIFFKKIDSAGRGPIAAEVLALHQALGTRAILLAPAFPAAGRTVRNSILEVRDACGPSARPSARIDLRTWFASEMRDAIAAIAHADEIAAAIERGKTILMCDSSTQSDLDALACAAESIKALLYAGSAGLARAMASLHPASTQAAAIPVASRTLVIAGTPHRVTNLQLATLQRTIQGRKDVHIVRIACAPGDEATVCEAFDSFDPDGLILTGGDTAQLAALALGAHSILLQGELAPGIPWGILQGGVAEGCIAITKSGGFGTATTLSDVLTQLSGAA